MAGANDDEKAALFIYNKYAADKSDMPLELRQRAVDMHLNSEDPTGSMLVAAGLLTADEKVDLLYTADSKGKLTYDPAKADALLKEWETTEEGKKKLAAFKNAKNDKRFISAFDAEKLRSYKNTGSKIGGFDKTWRPRVHMFDKDFDYDKYQKGIADITAKDVEITALDATKDADKIKELQAEKLALQQGINAYTYDNNSYLSTNPDNQMSVNYGADDYDNTGYVWDNPIIEEEEEDTSQTAFVGPENEEGEAPEIKYHKPKLGETLIGAAPGLFDIGRGLFEKDIPLELDRIDEVRTTPISLDEAQRAQDRAFAGQQKSIRNAAPGGASYLANQQQAYQRWMQNAALLAEKERTLNAGLEAQDNKTNASIQAQNMQAGLREQDWAAKQRAAKMNLIGSGMGYLGDMAAEQRKNKFMVKSYFPAIAPVMSDYQKWAQKRQKGKEFDWEEETDGASKCIEGKLIETATGKDLGPC